MNDNLFEFRRMYLTNEILISKRKIDLHAKKLDDLDATTLALHLHENTSENILLLHIGANNLTDTGLIDILTALQWHHNLEELYLANNHFTEIGMQALAESVGIFTKLKILSVGSCQMTDENLMTLCYQLPEMINLQQLLLNSNQIGDEGLMALTSLFATESLESLRVLHLGDNPITYLGLDSFFTTLQRNTSLKSLFLNDIGLDMDCIHALSDCLLKNKSITELNIGNTGFSDQAARIFWRILPQIQVTHIYLWNNHLTDVSIIELVKILEENTVKIEYMGLADNQIEEDNLLDDVYDYLKQNQLISTITTRYNKYQNTTETKTQQKNDDKSDDDDKEPIDENTQLDEMDKEMDQANMLEMSALKIENKVFKKEESENDPNQGKLKTYKWVGTSKEDSLTLHSKLEVKQ